MKQDVNKRNERIYTNRNGNVYNNTYKYTVYAYIIGKQMILI